MLGLCAHSNKPLEGVVFPLHRRVSVLVDWFGWFPFHVLDFSGKPGKHVTGSWSKGFAFVTYETYKDVAVPRLACFDMS